MGVTGLWRLIEPSGKPVPVETLENKVLAVDISIWLHQMVKGYQDAKGAPLPNAHLMGLFQRVCKLLYFRIKPVFVFDGGFPELKRETIAKRQDSKTKYNSESERLKRELALILGKKTAVGSLLGKQISPKKGNNSTDNNDNDDIFKLPALPHKEEESESESEEDSSSSSIIDLHSVDIESNTFKTLPVKEKYDLLIELKETRKMNSWGKLHELPKKSDNFSDFQMQRLLKRRKVQECLEETEKEMGDSGMSLNDLESLLNEEGIETKMDTLNTRRIASNDTTRFLLINDLKKAFTDAKKKTEPENTEPTTSETKNTVSEDEVVKVPKKRDELEEDLEKAIKMSLECVDDCDKNVYNSKTDDSWTSFTSDYEDSEEDYEEPDISSAKAYILQYSDFTNRAIHGIVSSTNKRNKSKSNIPNVDQVIDELNKEKSVIIDNVEISSDDDDDFVDESYELKKKTNEPSLNTDYDASSVTDSLNNKDALDITQSSVIFVENPVDDVIILDTSRDKDFQESEPNSFSTLINSKKESVSSDSEDEFEDVPDIHNESAQPVVQLTLNMGDVPDDDIFADVFCSKKEENKINIIPVNESNKNYEETTSHFEPDKREKIQSTEILESPINYEIHLPTKSANTDDATKNVSKQNEADNEIIVTEKVIDDAGSHSTIHLTPPNDSLSLDKLTSIADELQNQEQDILQEKGRLDRIGRNITEQMTKEAQELLQIFGIPYIIAPMEAEAQCAFLESINLTDGTITDDSDIWLFGGKTVYKNFFNQKKHVLQFLAERIERSFNLSREQFVLLALLVGSDYTTGVNGVGPVTAMEILSSFPFKKRLVNNETSAQGPYTHIIAGLQEFKTWVRAGKRTDNITLKKKLRNVSLTDDFPSSRVVQAYLEPNVEKSDEKFTWGKLDITILRDYTKAKFGWSQNKLDEIIKPVLKRMVDRKSQRTVQDYFKRTVEFQCLEDQMSKRVKAAVQKMGSDGHLLPEDVAFKEKDKTVKKRKVKGQSDEAGPSNKMKKNSETRILNNHGVKVVSQVENAKSSIEIRIPKTDRVQEVIPQREKDKQNLLQNKMKAIEIFRKSKIDRKRKAPKKRVNLPKEKAELSESSNED